MSISPTPLRRRLACLCVAAALLAGSCSREADVAPADPLDALSPVIRTAVLRQGLGNVFGTPDLENLTPYGDRAFTAPLPYPELQERSWELLLIATVDPEDYLHTAVILRPTERGDHYRQYGFSPDGYLQYQVEICKGEPVRWLVPQREDHYEAIFGRSDMTRSSGDDDELWDCGLMDECVIQRPYNHIKNEDGGDWDNWYDDNYDDTWWGDDPPPPTGGGGGGSGGNGSPNDDSKPDSNDPKDPCANIKNMTSNASLNAKLKEYMAYAKEKPFECSYTRTDKGQEATAEGLPGEVPISLEPNEKYSIIIHTHDLKGEGVGGYPIFSHNDILILYKALRDNHIEDMASFHFLVVGARGSYGALHINDAAKFKSFGEHYANDPRNLGSELKTYLYGDANEESMMNSFARFLEENNSGLAYLHTKDAEKLDWKTIESSSTGLPVSTKCN